MVWRREVNEETAAQLSSPGSADFKIAEEILQAEGWPSAACLYTGEALQQVCHKELELRVWCCGALGYASTLKFLCSDVMQSAAHGRNLECF